MKAARYYGPEQPLKIENVQIPKIENDDVLVKVQAAGLCHTDLHFLDGTLKPWKGTLPITLGHEISGDIVETGSKVKNFVKGDRVAISNCMVCVIIVRRATRIFAQTLTKWVLLSTAAMLIMLRPKKRLWLNYQVTCHTGLPQFWHALELHVIML